jgi:hypothetical protein
VARAGTARLGPPGIKGAAQVLAAHDKLGQFASADELCAYTELSPDRVDELRDLMLFA